MTGATIRRTLMIAAMAIAVAIAAAPASAQTGQVKGKVVDAKGQPVEGAKITLLNQQTNRSLETKSNKKGEYIQVGLSPGKYRITASKDSLSDTADVDIRLEIATHDFTLGAARGATGSKEDLAKAKAKADLATKAFNEGVGLSNEGKNDEAIAKFNEVIVVIPNCVECYANIGTVHTRTKKYDEAEAAFKKAIELKPDFAEAYNGLANLYNATKKFDQAAEASKKAMELSAAAGGAAGAAGAAGGGASASAVFNQGVILWNAGKIPDAKAQFEQAVKLDPNLADARYWLGMALVNTGTPEAMKEARPHFEAYIKLAPTGANVETAKAILATIK